MEQQVARYGAWHGILVAFFGSLFVFVIHFVVAYGQIASVLTEPDPGPGAGLALLWYLVGPCLLFLILCIPVVSLSWMAAKGTYRRLTKREQAPFSSLRGILIGAVVGSVGVVLIQAVFYSIDEITLFLPLVGGIVGSVASVFVLIRVEKYARMKLDRER